MLAGLAGLLFASARSEASMQDVQTVFIILMENRDWSAIRGSANAPYINNTLLPMASRAEQFYNPPGLHPSLPNYLWLEAGTNFGITSDIFPSTGHQSTTNHFVTQLKNAGISWTSYQEDITGTSCVLTNYAKYVPRHNPVVYFDDVTNTNSASSAYCIANVRPYTELATDLQNQTVTRYNFITPNLTNDMHDGATAAVAIKNGDTWLSNNIPAILSSQAYSNNGAIFITWDEGDVADGPIGMIVISPLGKGGGYTNTIHYTHSSTLRSLQEIFNVGPPLGDAANATDLSDLFRSVVLAVTGSNLVAESCAPANGVVDPGETVTVNLTLANTGSTNTSNLVVTLLPTGGVTSPTGPQTYGLIATNSSQTMSFTFTASGACGDSVTATFQLQDGAKNYGTVTVTYPLGQNLAPLTQNFDSVSAPALPAGWATATSGVESNWVTSTTQTYSAPNAAFSPDTTGIGVNELDTPTFAVGSSSARLTFRQSFNLTASTTNSSIGYDGGVLEIKIGAGSFADILAAGGSFVSGGYNTTLSGTYANPLAGRQAWSGNSGGFTTTVVNLPASASGQNVQLRWRCATGNAPTLPAIAIQSSGTLAFWNCENSNNVSIVDPNLSASVLTTLVSDVTGYVAHSPGFAITANGWSTAAGPPPTSTSCYTFSVTVNGGYQAGIATVSFEDQKSGTGPTNFTVQASQAANFSSVIYDSGVQTSHTSIASSTFSVPLSNVTGTVYFRLYGYKAGSSAGTWRIDNLNVQGSTASAIAGWYVDSVAISDPTCCETGVTPFEQWQILYFTSTNNPSAASGVDFDGDGFNNLQEFQAGTVPTNSASAFRITNVAVESNGVRVTWLTGTGKTNACDWSNDGNGGYSNNFTTIFIATNTIGFATNYLDTAATNLPARYYRIRLVP